ncbi:MAG: hypothetical protein AB7T38_13320 [Nitrospirales bacterium]
MNQVERLKGTGCEDTGLELLGSSEPKKKTSVKFFFDHATVTAREIHARNDIIF